MHTQPAAAAADYMKGTIIIISDSDSDNDTNLCRPRKKQNNNNNSSQYRNWSELHEPLLVSILDRLGFTSSLYAFSAVCRSFRSLATSRPPCLLVPNASSKSCTLKTIIGGSVIIEAPLPPELLSQPCIGYSNGHLIFAGQRPFLVDVFSLHIIRLPATPCPTISFTLGILTAPWSSASCTLLLASYSDSYTQSSTFLCWSRRDGDWAEFKLLLSKNLKSLVVFQGQILCMESIGFIHCLTVSETAPYPKWKPLNVQDTSSYRGGSSCYYLVECNSGLLLLCLPTVEIYRLCLEKSMWVKVESLGDWCVFVDAVGKSAMACHNPTRWGGKSNCVYIAGPGSDTWSVIPVGGREIDTAQDSSLAVCRNNLPRWSSPVWVSPF